MKSSDLKFAFIILVLLSSTTFAKEPAQRFQVVANRMVDAINEQDYPRIQQDFGKVMLVAFPLDQVKLFFVKQRILWGKIKKLDPPRLISPQQAVFLAHCERALLEIKVSLDDQDKITGLWFIPRISASQKHATVLRLPFEGQWFVGWGGDTKELNQNHHGIPTQNFAFDFVKVDENGKTHKNDGKKNEDYFAFGQKILAPADGVVTEVIDGVRDNIPGSMNPHSAMGNAVIIKHRENEVSVMAHFKQNSIQVKAGDQVKKGQVLALCGNSGNSSEAHLHYHLQNTPIVQDGMGIKCIFSEMSVRKDNKTRIEETYSPIKDDLVENK